MLIISCIKQVKDLDMVLDNDWIIQEETGDVDIYYANKVMNVYDEAALELMLRLADYNKENCNEEIKTKVISIGEKDCETSIRKALAVGVDQGIRLDYKQGLEDYPAHIAQMLYETIHPLKADLVLCGRQADNGSYGMTGQFLAEKFGWPCITMVMDITYKDGKFHVVRLTHVGKEHIKIKGPLVVTVLGGENQFLRMATLKSTMAAKKKDIIIQRTKTAKQASNQLRLSIEKSYKQCEFLKDNNKESVKDQLSKILEDNGLLVM